MKKVYWLPKLHSIGYLNCTKNQIRLDLLLILFFSHNNVKKVYWLPKIHSIGYLNCTKNHIRLNIVKKSVKDPVKIFFGQSKIHVRY